MSDYITVRFHSAMILNFQESFMHAAHHDSKISLEGFQKMLKTHFLCHPISSKSCATAIYLVALSSAL